MEKKCNALVETEWRHWTSPAALQKNPVSFIPFFSDLMFECRFGYSYFEGFFFLNKRVHLCFSTWHYSNTYCLSSSSASSHHPPQQKNHKVHKPLHSPHVTASAYHFTCLHCRRCLTFPPLDGTLVSPGPSGSKLGVMVLLLSRFEVSCVICFGSDDTRHNHCKRSTIALYCILRRGNLREIITIRNNK